MNCNMPNRQYNDWIKVVRCWRTKKLLPSSERLSERCHLNASCLNDCKNGIIDINELCFSSIQGLKHFTAREIGFLAIHE